MRSLPFIALLMMAAPASAQLIGQIPAEKRCSATADCTVIDATCSGFIAVNRTYAKEEEARIANHKAASDCAESDKSKTAPLSECLGGSCRLSTHGEP